MSTRQQIEEMEERFHQTEAAHHAEQERQQAALAEKRQLLDKMQKQTESLRTAAEKVGISAQ